MSKYTSRKIYRFASDEQGHVAVMLGMVVAPAIMLIGGAVDFGNAYKAQQKLQSAADSAVLAAASLGYDATAEARQSIATNIFNANLGVSGVTPIVTASNSAVSISASVGVPTAFLKIMHIDNISVGGNASAAVTYTTTTGTSTTTTTTSTTDGGGVCILALDPTATNGLISQGTPNVNYEGCWAHTNSTSTTALAGGGSASVIGAGHSAVGGVDSSATTVYSPAPVSGANVVDDPFATVSAYVTPSSSYTPTFTPPSTTGTCKASSLSLKKGTFTLEPGRYCGGIDLKAQATVTFQPGVYVIDNGVFNVQSGASISGTNVLFYFSGTNASFTVIGGGTINLKGRQTDSSYAGHLFIAHPDANRNGTSNIQGGGSFTMEGMIYAPTQNILITGNGDSNASSNFFALVAKSFEFRGNGIFRYKPWSSASGMPDIMPRRTTTTTTTTTVTGPSSQSVSRINLQ